MTALAVLAAPLLTAPADAAPMMPSAQSALTAAPATVTAADPWVVGTFEPMYRPDRLFDSRWASFGRPLRAGETVNVKVAGRGEVPARGLGAAVLNLTVTQPSRSGNITAVARGRSASGTSSLNFVAGDTRANLVTVPLDSEGWVSVRNNGTGTVHVVVDVQGYYYDGSGTVSAYDFFPLGSQRVLDTRGSAQVSPEATKTVPVRLGNLSLSNSTAALAVTVTVVSPSSNGYLSVWDGINYPKTSYLNYRKGQTTTNAGVVPVFTPVDDLYTRYIDISVFGGTAVDVIVDVNGAYSAAEPGGLIYRPASSPQRIVDTRTGRGTTTLGTADTNWVQAPSTAAPAGTRAVVANVTAVAPTASTFLSLWSYGASRPKGSNLNPAAGQTVAGFAVIPVSQGRFNIYNHAGRTDVVVDAVGRFEPHPAR
ncbi:MAG TPA: hypothetical protein VFL38_11935 [Humibacillus xanthopallidus]|nr:hypothetical protein [Humibacillus xanthopallidus]